MNMQELDLALAKSPEVNIRKPWELNWVSSLPTEQSYCEKKIHCNSAM